MGNTSAAGVNLDVDRMKDTFEKLNFVVMVRYDPSFVDLVALLEVAATYAYPTGFFRFIAFYFAGHGGSDDGHAFIYPSRSESSPLYVEEGIVEKFYPEEKSSSLGNRARLFFFDSCLKDDTVKGHGQGSAQFEEGDAMLPARGNILVAYATSLTFSSRGGPKNGGYWTRHLYRNLVDLDLSLSAVLDITWEQTVIATAKKNKRNMYKTQGPHYISCIGLAYLKRKDCLNSNACYDVYVCCCLIHGINCSRKTYHRLYFFLTLHWWNKYVEEILTCLYTLNKTKVATMYFHKLL